MDKSSSKKTKVNRNVLLFFFNCILGLFLCIMTILISSLLVFFEVIRLSSINGLSLIAVFGGTSVACILSCIQLNKNFFTAIIQAGLFFIAQYAIGMILFSRIIPSESVVWFAVMSLVSAIFSAVLSAFFRGFQKHNWIAKRIVDTFQQSVFLTFREYKCGYIRCIFLFLVFVIRSFCLTNKLQ